MAARAQSPQVKQKCRWLLLHIESHRLIYTRRPLLFQLFEQPLRNVHAFEWNSSRSSSIFGCRWVERRVSTPVSCTAPRSGRAGRSIYGALDPKPQRAGAGPCKESPAPPNEWTQRPALGVCGLYINIRAWQWVMIVYL